jgi:beta-lactamase regulating signal transducer with metallopeptidase domain
MIVYSTSWKLWLAGLAVSVGIFAVIYFTVIKPTTDNANKVLTNSLQDANQQLNKAKQQAPNAQAKKELIQVQKLTTCLQDAGTDTSAVADCQAKFGP